MNIARTVRSFTHDWLTPVSVTETEIREELQFHLDMSTADNIAAGMDPDAAAHDAHTKFGDFENNFRACRRASLGLRVVFHRVQLVFILLLVATVACLVTALLRTQSQYESELRALRSTLQASQPQPLLTLGSESNEIPFHQWSLPVEAAGAAERRALTEASASAFVPSRLDEPWCDWRALEE